LFLYYDTVPNQNEPDQNEPEQNEPDQTNKMQPYYYGKIDKLSELVKGVAAGVLEEAGGDVTTEPGFLGVSGCCQLHVNPLRGSSVVEGCGGCSAGLHPAISEALACGDEVGGCALDEATRKKDRAFAEAIADDSCDNWWLMGTAPWAKRYMTSDVVEMVAFGAGYCYLHMVEPRARMRVARVLGPCPKVIDVLRVVRVVGASSMPVLQFEEVGLGMFHVRKLGEHWPGEADIDDAVLTLAVLAETPNMRIGVRKVDCGYRLSLPQPAELVGSWMPPPVLIEGRNAAIGYAGEEHDWVVGVLLSEQAVFGQEVIIKRGLSRADGMESIVDYIMRVIDHDSLKHLFDDALRLLFWPPESGSEIRKFVRRPQVPSGLACAVCGVGDRSVEHVRLCGFLHYEIPGWSLRRNDLWLCDVVMRLDVQMLMVVLRIPPVRWGEVLKKVRTEVFRCGFWGSALASVSAYEPKGGSVQEIARAIDENYDGEFRRQFLLMLPWSSLFVFK
jgi:hypothetical protein